MAADDRKEVSISVHGLDVDNRAVRAQVFLDKFRAVLTSLRAADKAANQRPIFRYMIADLSISSASARVEERLARKKAGPASGVQLYSQAMTAIYEGDKNIDRFPVAVIRSAGTLGRHAGKTFAHAEVKFEDHHIIRIDQFFEEQTNRALRRLSGEEDEPEKFYDGIAYSSFDGVLRELDSRGSLVQGKVILSAGGVEIDCIFNRDDIPHIRECFERRAVIEAVAHYHGRSPLPVRLDVRGITPIKEEADLERWRGALKRRRIPSTW